MDDFEIVTMEDAPSPEPAPPEVAAPKGRKYEEVVNDDTKAEVFSQNGVCYYIKNLIPNKDITQAMLKHGGCVECYTRAKKFCGLLDKNCQPVFLKNVLSKEDGWSDDTELGSFFNVREKCIEVNKNKIKLPRGNWKIVLKKEKNCEDDKRIQAASFKFSLMISGEIASSFS